jgi:hypothetical protein
MILSILKGKTLFVMLTQLPKRRRKKKRMKKVRKRRNKKKNLMKMATLFLRKLRW